MRIFICDDEEIFLREEKRICENFFDDDFELEIIEGTEGKAVIEYENAIDLLLLDIDMPGLDGIAVKNALWEKNSETIILFITNHEERMREAFGMNVLGFVDKGRMQEEIPMFLEKIAGEFSYQWIDGEMGERYKSAEINYVKADGKNYLRLAMRNGEDVLLRGSLKEMENILREVDFVRVHREYLVNMRRLSDFTGKTVFIEDREIPVSARKQGEVKRLYREFQRKKMRYR